MGEDVAERAGARAVRCERCHLPRDDVNNLSSWQDDRLCAPICDDGLETGWQVMSPVRRPDPLRRSSPGVRHLYSCRRSAQLLRKRQLCRTHNFGNHNF